MAMGKMARATTVDRYIHDEYERIVQELEGGFFMGQLVDTENPEMLVVAAYHMASLERLQQNRQTLKQLSQFG